MEIIRLIKKNTIKLKPIQRKLILILFSLFVCLYSFKIVSLYPISLKLEWHSIFFISIIISTVFCFILIKYFSNVNYILDNPNSRKLHKKPIITIGGIAIIIGSLSGLIISPYNFFENLFSTEIFNIVLILGLVIYIIGLIDDIFKISPFLRLSLQFGLALTSWYSGARITDIHIPFLHPFSPDPLFAIF